MTTESFESKKQKEDNKDAAAKPDPETLHTTDPQEHMEGPLSSLMKPKEKMENEETGNETDN